MPNFYSPPENRQGEIIWLRGSEAHHMCRVLRKRPGEKVVVVDGEGNEFTCVIDRCEARKAEVKVLSVRRKPKEPVSRVTLAVAIPKGERMDRLIEKATELGVYRIIPIICERSNVKGVGKQKSARWKRIALSAIKQCERSLLPRIEETRTLVQLEKDLKSYQWGIAGWELSKRRVTQNLFPREPVGDVIVIVGPEGGLTEQEVKRLGHSGVLDVWLGERKLRVETAAIVLVSLVLNYYGDL